MSTNLLLVVTGLGLGALYFLVASGLSLIFGLMRVLNFAHGAFLTVGAYVGYEVGTWLSGTVGFALALLAGMAAGAAVAAATELVLIRPLYGREVDQILITVGLAFVVLALVRGIAGTDPLRFPTPDWVSATTKVAGAHIPHDRLLVIAVAALVLAGLLAFLRHTRYGLIIRAGVENRAMVTALGIDVRRAFTLVFAIGGAAAGAGGVLAGVYYGSVGPSLGASLLIFAFIVVVIGGLGSLSGSAIAAAVVGLVQQFANYYAVAGVGNLSVVLLLAIVLLARPAGLSGSTA